MLLQSLCSIRTHTRAYETIDRNTFCHGNRFRTAGLTAAHLEVQCHEPRARIGRPGCVSSKNLHSVCFVSNLILSPPLPSRCFPPPPHPLVSDARGDRTTGQAPPPSPNTTTRKRACLHRRSGAVAVDGCHGVVDVVHSPLGAPHSVVSCVILSADLASHPFPGHRHSCVEEAARTLNPSFFSPRSLSSLSFFLQLST